MDIFDNNYPAYEARHMRELLKMGKPTFDRWLQAGLLVPTVRGSSGVPSKWSLYDALVAYITVELSNVGFQIRHAREYAKRLCAAVNDPDNVLDSIELTGSLRLEGSHWHHHIDNFVDEVPMTEEQMAFLDAQDKEESK